MNTTKVLRSAKLLAVSLVGVALFSSCGKDAPRDTEKPVIKLNDPADGEHVLIGDDHGLHFECELSDNEMVDSYRIEIHANFDGHTHTHSSTLRHGDEKPFHYDRSWKVGKRNAHIHHHDIVVPKGVAEGNYHFVIYCTDASQNETMTYRSIVLTEDPNKAGHHH